MQGGHDACHVCGEEVEGDCLLSGDNTFHPKCMKVCSVYLYTNKYHLYTILQCSVCGERLGESFCTVMDQLVCEKDYKAGLMQPKLSKDIFTAGEHTLLQGL